MKGGICMYIHNDAFILHSHHKIVQNESVASKTMNRLSSGLKVHSSADDASGLAISEQMRGQIRGLSQAQRNIQDGMSLIKATEEGLVKIQGILQRVNELAVQSANDTMTASDRENAQMEVTELLQTVDDTAKNLEFNTIQLLGPENEHEVATAPNGSAPKLLLHVGANPRQTYEIELFDVRTENLAVKEASILTQKEASELITKTQNSVNKISHQLARIGSYYEALEHHFLNNSYYEANLTLSESLIRDADMAKESFSFLSVTIRQQADQMLVTQANQQPKKVLSLVTG